MAALNRCTAGLLVLVCLVICMTVQVQSNPVNIPLSRVPLTLWERAWKALNNHSPTHHLYAQGNLINAQELEEPPYKIYKFTYDLSPICGAESCPREACTIDLKQDENGEVETLNDSIQCMYFYPADTQNEVSQEQQSDQGTSYQEQEDPGQVTESLTEQMNRGVELDHEVQETTDENTRPFIAVRASSTNYCPGCPYELDPQLMGLLPFADQALRLMDEQSKGDYKHKLIKIVKVTRSVPISSNVIRYQVLLLIGESKCLKNTLELDECSLREDASARLCLFTFEKPWRQIPLRITKNNCTDTEDDSGFTSTSQQPDLESQSLVTVKYDDGQLSRTEADNAYEGLKELLDNYTYAPTPSESNSEPKGAAATEPTIVKVVLNRSQDDQKIVGFSNKAKEYSEFLEDFYVPVKTEQVTPDTREVVEEEEFKRKRVTMENVIAEETASGSAVNRMKRSLAKRGLVGAPSSISINDPEIREYTEKGLHQFSQELDSPNEPILIEIIDASVQVVSGKLYKINVKLGTSDCPKGTKNNCQLQIDSEVKECLITVWSQPWIDQGSPKITVNCSTMATKNSQRRKRDLADDYVSDSVIFDELETKRQLFKEFKDTYNRTYVTSEEESFRFRVFLRNLGIIMLLQQTEKGSGQYGINQFADLSQDEFRKNYLGLRQDLQLENEIPLQQAEIPDIELPSSFDWRKKNVVTPVKDQGACGSCWAFSVTGNVEGQYSLKHGKLLSLSEQELVDCDDLDEGCNGGLPSNAYKAIEKLGGLELESDYPYEAEDEKCHFKENKAKVKLVSAVNITSNETKMAQWLVANGPISIGINANAMQFYIGGVSHPFKILCNPKNLDHGVLIVGYGTSKYPLFHKTLPYWIIKNSWGKGWGEQGYYRVYRGDGTCGLNTMASSAVVV